MRGGWGSSLLMTQTLAFSIGLCFLNVLFYFLVLIRSPLENVMHYEILTSLPQPVLSFRLRIKCSKPFRLNYDGPESILNDAIKKKYTKNTGKKYVQNSIYSSFLLLLGPELEVRWFCLFVANEQRRG